MCRPTWFAPILWPPGSIGSVIRAAEVPIVWN
jgi:hypothetical protein